MVSLNLRELYFHSFSAVGMIFILMGTISLINSGVRMLFIPNYPIQDICYESADFVAHEAASPERSPGTKTELRDCNEQELSRNRLLRRERRVERIAGGIIISLVGIPLFLYHWRIVRGVKA